MTYALYLDDVRPIPDGYVAARCSLSAITIMVEKGCPSFISFDHDLGEQDTGMVVVNWMINRDLNKGGTFIPKDFDFAVHSANPCGAANIEGKLRQYLKVR